MSSAKFRHQLSRSIARLVRGGSAVRLSRPATRDLDWSFVAGSALGPAA